MQNRFKVSICGRILGLIPWVITKSLPNVTEFSAKNEWSILYCKAFKVSVKGLILFNNLKYWSVTKPNSVDFTIFKL